MTDSAYYHDFKEISMTNAILLQDVGGLEFGALHPLAGFGESAQLHTAGWHNQRAVGIEARRLADLTCGVRGHHVGVAVSPPTMNERPIAEKGAPLRRFGRSCKVWPRCQSPVCMIFMCLFLSDYSPDKPSRLRPQDIICDMPCQNKGGFFC